LELLQRYSPDNIIAFDGIPAPTSGTVDAEGRYHEVRADGWGAQWEYLIFGIAGHPCGYPVASWEEAADYAFPPLGPSSGPDFEAGRQRTIEEKREYLVAAGGVSLFERLNALRPFDDVLMALALRDPALVRVLERLEGYWATMIDTQLALGVDAIWFGDDWGAQTGPIVSPTLFRDLFLPAYRRLFARTHATGAKVFFHCCGFLGEIFGALLDAGIDLIWPQIGWFESDPARFDLCRERGVGVYIHPDRQRLIPLGSPGQIRREMQRYAQIGKRLGGGLVFYIEIENDAPFENVEALITSVHEFR